MKKICVIGLGYIGLPTAAMFASNGHKVIGVDINNEVIDALEKGEVIIEEPYLKNMVEQEVASGNLIASKKPQEADAFIIAVPTPLTEDKKADMSLVEKAAESIVPYLRTGNIVVLESTSPTGTVKNLIIPILEKSGLKIGDELYVGYCPERVLPGQILFELVNNNRIIGTINRKSAEEIKELYQTFVKGEIYLTDTDTAEMCKIVENTYRDVNIAFANELAKICEDTAIDVDVWEVIKLCNKHPRVNIHQPGPGVGGHCLAVDPWFIVEKNPELARIIRLARETNDSMPQFIFNKIENILKNINPPKKITILGITYKANIDDVRESPIITLIKLLEEHNYKISAVDPYVKKSKYKVDTISEAVKDSDLLVLAVNHKDFKEIDFDTLAPQMRNKIVLDTRNYFDRNIIENKGFKYYLLGKAN
ncbi:MAG TPA: UDP-N-acetyl-D-mannosamine dehydrogenase [Candidatus Atribacteria bacterium]|uniref:Nucleotide sugar dehydrogenase n=1 Tax=candidate division TA06 bacterium 34_109 TaxID=1635277 RepID=A0A124G029_UNCT6|nr:MAG: Nucleotide sugar dehydrogenase [candidate division TA06 bacterium 34_109]HBY58142.1 UDP-N-acetyl-D-mannosamine dehydrogenase [Candidatus Atribacteria bacterium]